MANRLARRAARVIAFTAVTLGLLAPAASAADLLTTTVAAPTASDRVCHSQAVTAGAGVASFPVTVPATGLVSARLTAASGDWDLSIFDARSGRVVAASEGFGASEVAEGFAVGGRALTVQACRLSGSAGTAQLSVGATPLPTGGSDKLSLVRVSTPTPASKDLLNTLGLDLTEHAGPDFVEVVLHGTDDATKLTGKGLAFNTRVPDLVADAAENAQKDKAYAAAFPTSPLPSGVDAYRHLWEYEAALKELVRHYPTLVKPLVLPYKTNEGREVYGVEITKDPNASDGKPVFAIMGVHHAREWPSGENTIEFAFDLAMNYTKSARIKGLVDKTRTVVVPIINPDGFNLSREASVDLGEPLQQEGGDTGYTAAILADPDFAYKRRNCRVLDGQDAPGGICGLFTSKSLGTDPNRNYGGLWGGPGASSLPNEDTYRGAGPFSEPETQNVRNLVSTRQVTTLISNHTFAALVLRPPGLRAQGPPPDETIYKALGDKMSAQNGYTSQPGYALYDTTGTTEDWTYPATGGLGFTFELGGPNFHPTFQEGVVDNYLGAGPLAGKGNREAYLIALENTADVSKHSVLTGSGQAGSTIRVKKSFVTETSPVVGVAFETAEVGGIFGTIGTMTTGGKILFEDTLETTMKVPSSGKFEYHVNPSTRPAAVEKRLPTVSATPFRSQTWENSEASETGTYTDRDFKVTKDDKAKLLKVSLDWPTPDDYDLEVYKKEGADLKLVGSSLGSLGAKEIAYVDDPAQGDYVLRVINYTAVGPTWTMKAELFKAGPDQVTPGTKEYWTFSCETPGGRILTQKIDVKRGQRLAVDRPCSNDKR